MDRHSSGTTTSMGNQETVQTVQVPARGIESVQVGYRTHYNISFNKSSKQSSAQIPFSTCVHHLFQRRLRSRLIFRFRIIELAFDFHILLSSVTKVGGLASKPFGLSWKHTSCPQSTSWPSRGKTIRDLDPLHPQCFRFRWSNIGDTRKLGYVSSTFCGDPWISYSCLPLRVLLATQRTKQS